MKKLMFATLALCIGLTFSFNSYAQEEKKETTEVKKEVEVKVEAAEVVEVSEGTPLNSICPVSREQIDEDGKLFTYKGNTYAVCCGKCLKKIKADPEKYMSRIEVDKKVETEVKEEKENKDGAGILPGDEMKDDHCDTKTENTSCCSTNKDKTKN